jgi:hypothetical protein
MTSPEVISTAYAITAERSRPTLNSWSFSRRKVSKARGIYDGALANVSA